MKSTSLKFGIALVALAGGLSMATTSLGQTAPQSTTQSHSGPVCTPITFDLGTLPAGVDITAVNIDPLKYGACADATGDALTLVATSSVPTISSAHEGVVQHTWKTGQSTTVTYSVTDGWGNTATSTITIKRD